MSIADKTEDSYKLSKETVIWSYIVALLFTVVGIGFFYFDRTIIGFVAVLYFDIYWIGLAVIVSVYHYRNYISARNKGTFVYNPDFKNKMKEIYSRPVKGDIFKICNRYRMKYYWSSFIIIQFFAHGIPFCIYAHFVANELKPSAVWVFAPTVIMLVGSVLVFFIASITGKGFKTEKDLKRAIEAKNLDVFKVNNDFMSASHNDLNFALTTYGVLAIGQSYYVIHSKKLSYVGLINDISMVEVYSKIALEDKKAGNTIRYFVKIIEDDVYHDLSFSGRVDVDAIVYEFNKIGIICDTSNLTD